LDDKNAQDSSARTHQKKIIETSVGKSRWHYVKEHIETLQGNPEDYMETDIVYHAVVKETYEEQEKHRQYQC